MNSKLRVRSSSFLPARSAGRDDDIAIDEPVELAGHAWLQMVVLAVFYEGAEEEDGVLLFSSAAQLGGTGCL